jgi:hypothetical protein
MPDIFMESAKHTLEEALHAKGYIHLNVRTHGKNLVIYSEEHSEKINRSRLTRINSQTYRLSMANHQGKWEPTPYEGPLSEMINMITEQFAFTLVEW